jgi:hypothetical protein
VLEARVARALCCRAEGIRAHPEAFPRGNSSTVSRDCALRLAHRRHAILMTGSGRRAPAHLGSVISAATISAAILRASKPMEQQGHQQMVLYL